MATGHPRTISDWWYTYPSEIYEFVSWDGEIPKIWKNKIHVPNHHLFQLRTALVSEGSPFRPLYIHVM